MKNKEMFINALETLFFSFGGDTPGEVIWGANELLDWFEKEYSVKLNIRFNESLKNYDKVVDKIKNS